MKAVIFDIDGTIADLSHRLHFIKQEKKDYRSFHDACDKDLPIEPIIDLVFDMHARGYSILFVSGRTDRIRDKTEEWLRRYSIPWVKLYMRKDGDWRPDHKVKSDILDNIIKEGYNIKFAVDDRDSIVKMWRERGIICLQCREWND